MANDDPKRALADLWREVLARWDEKAMHDVLLDHARTCSLLPDAAALYRGVKDDEAASEERRAFAQKRLTAIAFVAMQALDTARTTPKPGLPRWVTYAVALISAAVSIWAMKQVFRP